MARACRYLCILLVISSVHATWQRSPRLAHLDLCHLCEQVTELLSESSWKTENNSLIAQEKDATVVSNQNGKRALKEDRPKDATRKGKPKREHKCDDASLTWPYLSNLQCQWHHWCNDVSESKKTHTLPTYTVAQPCEDDIRCDDDDGGGHADVAGNLMELASNLPNVTFCKAHANSCRKSCGCCEFPGAGSWCDDTFRQDHNVGIPHDLTGTELFVMMDNHHRKQLRICVAVHSPREGGHCGAECKSCSLGVLRSWYRDATDRWLSGNNLCVAVTHPCSGYTCNQHLVVQSENADGELTVVNIDDNDTEAWTVGTCHPKNLKSLPETACVHYHKAVAIGSMAWLLVMGLLCCECCGCFALTQVQSSRMSCSDLHVVYLCIIIYWANSFLSTIFVSSFVANYLRGSGFIDLDQKFTEFASKYSRGMLPEFSLSELICTQIISYLVFHVPVRYVATSTCILCKSDSAGGKFGRFIWPFIAQCYNSIVFGALYGTTVIYEAYAPLWVAVFGHNVISLALVNEGLNLLKKSVYPFAKNCVFQTKYCDEVLLAEFISDFPSPDSCIALNLNDWVSPDPDYDTWDKAVSTILGHRCRPQE